MLERLKIKYFGSIKEGYSHNNGFLLLKKVNVMTGPQASGKSTVAKLFALFLWLEKALERGDVKSKYVTQYNRFRNIFCKYSGLSNFFHENTYLQYIGNAYQMTFEEGRFSIDMGTSRDEYLYPKVMYIPAERNLISVIDGIENVKHLPDELSTLVSRYSTACRRLSGDLQLPLDGFLFSYDKQNKIAKVISKDKHNVLRLSETASGIQSLVPMYLVMRDFAIHLGDSLSNRSERQKATLKKRIEGLLMDSSLTDETRKVLLEQVSDIQNKRLIGIIEEPEQNLFPLSQDAILNALLSLNQAGGNKLFITTHSPYIINSLALSIKAGQIKQKFSDDDSLDFSSVLPNDATLKSEDVGVYEIKEDGSIEDIQISNGILTDDNIINNYLMVGNEKFNDLLEMEDEHAGK